MHHIVSIPRVFDTAECLVEVTLHVLLLSTRLSTVWDVAAAQKTSQFPRDLSRVAALN